MSSGIYQIRNIVNNKIYVGSAVNFIPRWNLHSNRANRGIHHSKHFQRAWDTYGSVNFIFEIIEIVKNEHLIEREQYWLDTLKPWNPKIGYNSCKIAGSVFGYKWNEEQLIKHSKRNSGEKNGMYGKRGENNPNFGSKRNELSLEKMKLAQGGKNNPMYGKIGKDNPTSKKILQKTKNGEIIKIWDCLSDISRELGFSAGNISSCCNGNLKSSKGYRWSFV